MSPDQRTLAGGALHLQAEARFLHPLAHRLQPEMDRVVALGIKANTVISHFQDEVVFDGCEGNSDVSSLRVLGDVIKCFLSYSIKSLTSGAASCFLSSRIRRAAA